MRDLPSAFDPPPEVALSSSDLTPQFQPGILGAKQEGDGYLFLDLLFSSFLERKKDKRKKAIRFFLAISRVNRNQLCAKLNENSELSIFHCKGRDSSMQRTSR